MIHPIILFDNPILRAVSAPLDLKGVNKADTRELIDDMFETMHRANGIGLSAIQISVPIRMFVVEAHIPDENFHLRETFINPKIISTSGKNLYLTEGCLSLPAINALVERPEIIELEYLDYNFEKQTKTFDSYGSRIIQHELDHLDGIIFTDKLEHMWKLMLEDPMNDIKKGEVKPAYLHK